MITYEKWQAALSDEAMAGVAAMFDGAKNKNTCIDLIRWFTATGRVWRTRDGLNIVRGSVKGRPDGMKEDPFLQSIGITAAKIRGFIKLALERGVLEILSPPNQPDEDGDLWRYNRNGRPRNPAIVYRFSKSFLATLRKGQSRQESGTRVALQAVAKPSCSSSVLAPIDEGYSGIRSSGGYLPSAPFPAPRATPRIPLPPKAPAVPVQPQPLPSAPV